MDVEQDTSMLLTWFGLPFAEVPIHPFKNHDRYILAAYDQSGQSRFLQSGIILNRCWRTNAASSSFTSLFLRAGEVLFFMDYGSSGVNLLATPAARDLYFSHARAANQCMVILGCENRGCPNQLEVDNTGSRKLPLRLIFSAPKTTLNDWLKDVGTSSSVPWIEALNAIPLEQGEHILEFSAKNFRGAGSVKLSCEADVVTYVVIDPIAMGQELMNWRIEMTGVMPSQYKRRPLVLMSDGQWSVEQEPKN
jgi:hypothetical protein